MKIEQMTLYAGSDTAKIVLTDDESNQVTLEVGLDDKDIPYLNEAMQEGNEIFLVPSQLRITP